MSPRKSKKAAEEAVKVLDETLTAKVKPAQAPKKTGGRAKKAAAKQAPDNKGFIFIDHPINSEIVSGLHYAIRIGASDNGWVELSFNDGAWQPCRHSVGYWWFDWGYYTSGTYKLTARLKDGDGKIIATSKTVKCEVR
ncbi:MAG: hypothetical protein JW803_02920 [Endomicrobiales bacterium]|nr:hypothetical protein [Endomicrobiales bacterium]